jgi:ABC-type oligopeptide transport system ATPase subunit
MPMAETLLSLEGLKVHFPIRSAMLRRQIGTVRAVDGVDLTVARGETLAVVGESGCGKTTTGKAILRLVEATEGAIRLGGEDIARHDARRLAPFRRRMQIIFQDPHASLNPRLSVGSILAAPFEIHGIGDKSDHADRVAALLKTVGLPPEAAQRYPHEFSGGQRQRIAIARALITRPRLIVADEPVSALDVSVQAQVLNLMQDLQDKLGVTYLFISHDLAVVDLVCDEVIVLHQGRIVEQGHPDDLFQHPQHPYTQRLLAAVPAVPGMPSAAARTPGTT